MLKSRKRNERKDMSCKKCGDTVTNVGHDVVAVTCWKCVNASLREFTENSHKSNLDNVQSNTRSSE